MLVKVVSHLVVPVPDGDSVLGSVVVIQGADVVGLRPSHNQWAEQSASVMKTCTSQVHYNYTVRMSSTPETLQLFSTN